MHAPEREGFEEEGFFTFALGIYLSLLSLLFEEQIYLQRERCLSLSECLKNGSIYKENVVSLSLSLLSPLFEERIYLQRERCLPLSLSLCLNV